MHHVGCMAALNHVGFRAPEIPIGTQMNADFQDTNLE
jgi:hypothetical protein